jgi:hypothetical protein
MSSSIDILASLLKETSELYADAAAKAHMASLAAVNTPNSSENSLLNAATAYHKACASAEKAREFLDALTALAVTEEIDAQEALAVVEEEEEAKAKAIADDAAVARSLVEAEAKAIADDAALARSLVGAE